MILKRGGEWMCRVKCHSRHNSDHLVKCHSQHNSDHLEAVNWKLGITEGPEYSRTRTLQCTKYVIKQLVIQIWSWCTPMLPDRILRSTKWVQSLYSTRWQRYLNLAGIHSNKKQWQQCHTRTQWMAQGYREKGKTQQGCISRKASKWEKSSS